jgi:single-strand selective monofunctional uracil DNA glycosylase
VQDTFATPERFFAEYLVINYCPLVFLEASGRNRTPDRLPAAEREPLLEACDQALRRTIDVLQPELLIGVGRFARLRAEQATGGAGPRIGEILHPSPASPAANRGWRQRAVEQLVGLGLELP